MDYKNGAFSLIPIDAELKEHGVFTASGIIDPEASMSLSVKHGNPTLFRLKLRIDRPFLACVIGEWRPGI